MRPSFSPRRLTAIVSALVMLDMVTWLAAVPLIPVWQDEIGLSAAQAGIVLGGYSLAVLFSSVPAGLLGDRFGPRRVTLVAAAAFAFASPAIAFADSFESLLAVRLAQGLCSSVVWSAGLAWLAGALPAESRNRSLYITNATATAATIAGPVFGGPIVAQIGLLPAFGAVGVAVALVVVWALIEPAGAIGHVHEHVPGGTRRVFHAARERGLLRISLVSILWVSLAMGVLQLLGPITLDRAGFDSARIGWVFTAGSVLSVGAILAVARFTGRFDRVHVVVPLTLLVGGLALVLIAPIGIWGYAAVLVVMIALSSPVFTMAYTLCADGARDAGVGEGAAFGTLNGLWAIGAVVSPVVAGVAEVGGVAAVAYALTAATSVLAVLIIRRSVAPIAAA